MWGKVMEQAVAACTGAPRGESVSSTVTQRECAPPHPAVSSKVRLQQARGHTPGANWEWEGRGGAATGQHITSPLCDLHVRFPFKTEAGASRTA